MDAKHEINKLLDNLQESAREFAGLGLEKAGKALDFTAAKLASLKAELDKSAERIRKTAEPSEPAQPTQ
jgi:hypothetical protein